MNKQITTWIVLLLVVASVSACGGAAERKAKYLELGRSYYTQGNIEKAQIELKNALQIDPKDAEARYLMGMVQEQKQDFSAAVANYRAAVENKPAHVQARVRLGRIYVLGNAPDRAMEMVDAALKLEPANPDVLALRAAVRLNKGNTPGATADAQAVLQQKPGHPDATSLLTGIYSRGGQGDKAVALLLDTLKLDAGNTTFRALLAEIYDKQGQRDRAVEQLVEIVRIEPDKLAHRLRLFAFYQANKQIGEAEKVLREAVAHDPEVVEAKMALVEFLGARKGHAVAEETLLKFIAEDRKAYPLRFGLARLQLSRNEVEKAAVIYQELIDDLGTAPQGLEARTYLARLRFAQGKVPEAERLVSEVLERNSRDNEALMLRGSIALARQDATAAIADFRSVLKDQPQSGLVLRMLGMAHARNDEQQLAIDNLKKAVEVNPLDAESRLQLGQALLRSRDVVSARAQFEAVLKNDSKNLAALESLFRVNMLKKDHTTAAGIAQRVRSAYPDVGMGYYLSGMLNQERKNHTAAIADFEAALKKSPRASEPLVALVGSYLALKQPDQAASRLQHIVAEMKDHAAAHNLLGELELVRQNPDAAIASFQIAVDLIPGDALFARNLASAYLAAKSPEAAERTLKQGLAATKGDAALQLELATLYQRLNRNDDAIEQYEAILKRNTNSQIAANNLAMLLATYRDDKKSLARASTLADRLASSDNPVFLDTVGWVRYKQGQYDSAVAALEKALAKSPKEPLLRYHLGMAYFHKGDRQRASEHLQQAVDSKAAFHGREDAQSTLSRLRSS